METTHDFLSCEVAQKDACKLFANTFSVLFQSSFDPGEVYLFAFYFISIILGLLSFLFLHVGCLYTKFEDKFILRGRK
jgi:hypothetical protein